MSEPVLGSDGSKRLPIPMGSDVERFDLVAELAFEMARARYEGADIQAREIGIERAIRKVAALERQIEIERPHSHELLEAEALLSMYLDFFNEIGQFGTIRFAPEIRGVGIVDAMKGDFCSEDTLYEVKCVNRNLQSSDLRQVLCYVVAGLASRDYAWNHYCIFNPRRGVYYAGRIDQLIISLSGKGLGDCIRDVVESLMEREQILELTF